LKYEHKKTNVRTSNSDKAIGKFLIRGPYRGNLWDAQTIPIVQLQCVVSLTFCPNSAKIQELVVSNDLLGLFQSLKANSNQKPLILPITTRLKSLFEYNVEDTNKCVTLRTKS
jgi:hypothetical protein